MVLLAAMMALGPKVTFDSLLAEMTDLRTLSRWPNPEYESLLATSYNRESKRRDLPGWFADSDGTGYIREEMNGPDREFVMMEHTGPGCITKIWTPFFYYDFNERTGPNVRIYLDGNPTPVIDESLIKLVTGHGSIENPWAAYSARAGNLYLPIPFAKSAKVTMRAKPFYFSVNYRAYPKSTSVETFRPSLLASRTVSLNRTKQALFAQTSKPQVHAITLAAGQTIRIPLPKGEQSLRDLTLRLSSALSSPAVLRSTVVSAKFDGEETIWAPIGDFFSCPDGIHPFTTLARTVLTDGTMHCRWSMPYRKTGELSITNFGRTSVKMDYGIQTAPEKWDRQSMHFHARWRPDNVVPGTPFTDWNFVDISGKGVYVGDAWTVLNIRRDSWWGEGDEKIYVDGAWDRGFPTHFGTGTEDYYGWAGGVYPVLEDQFSAPYLANVKVGGLDGHTLGFNINARHRGLDAIPFHTRLRFDMESSFGTDMREKWNLLGYSSMVYFYAFPGAHQNRPANPSAAQKPLMSIDELERISISKRGNR